MEKCKTLGERKDTYFLFSYIQNELIIVYGFSKPKQKFVILDDEFIAKIIHRTEELKEKDKETKTSNHRKSSYYTDTKWDETANRIYSPYVAKLVLDVFPEEIIKQIRNKYPEQKIYSK